MAKQSKASPGHVENPNGAPLGAEDNVEVRLKEEEGGDRKGDREEETDEDDALALEGVTDGEILTHFRDGVGHDFLYRDAYMVIARDGLNLRSGPGVEFGIIKSIPFETPLHLLGREGHWGLVDLQGDKAADGYVHLSFLKAVASGEIFEIQSVNSDQVRRFWTSRNPRGARLYGRNGSALVDPQLLHASADAIVSWEAQNQNHRIEIYGPGGGFRTSGSTTNHGAQPGTGRGAALDFVLIDRTTKKMLTNHPGRNHRHQGSVGENAPLYQTFFNEVVRSGSKLYDNFTSKARFGGYFATGVNALDTMHIDMRAQKARTGGGSTTGGFSREQMSHFRIPSNHPYR